MQQCTARLSCGSSSEWPPSQVPKSCIRIVYLPSTSFQEQRLARSKKPYQGSSRRSLVQKLPHHTPWDGSCLSWLAKTVRDAHSHCSVVAIRVLLQLAPTQPSFFFAFLSAFYRYFQGQVPGDIDSGRKSKKLASRETTVWPFIARSLSLLPHLLEMFSPLLALIRRSSRTTGSGTCCF
jgi:hypothetical protein